MSSRSLCPLFFCPLFARPRAHLPPRGRHQDERIWAIVAELEPRNPTAASASEGVLDGVYVGVYQTLFAKADVPRSANLSQLSFGVLPSAKVALSITEQLVDVRGGRYDNLIHFAAADAAEGRPGEGAVGSARFEGVAAIRGTCSPAGPQEPLKVKVTFQRAEIFPEEEDVAAAGGAGGAERAASADARVRAGLGLGPGAALGGALPPAEGWNVTTFFDGDVRISKGNRGNYYILRRARGLWSSR